MENKTINRNLIHPDFELSPDQFPYHTLCPKGKFKLQLAWINAYRKAANFP